MALALGATLPLVVACGLERHLARDGAYHFERVVDTGDFFVADRTRLFAYVFTQWPLVAAARAGVRDVRVLAATYGAGILSASVLSLLASWHALPPGRRAAMALPIWSLLVVVLPADGFLSHESKTMVALMWPAIFLLWRDEPRTRRQTALLTTCMVGLTLSYTSQLASYPLLAAGAWRQLRRAAPHGEPDRVAWLTLLLIAAGTVASIGAIVSPELAQPRAWFLSGISWAWTSGQTRIGVATCLAFVWACRTGQRALSLVGAALALVGVAWLLGGLPPAPDPYAARTLTITVLPLLLLSWPLSLRKLDRWPAAAWWTTLIAVCLFGSGSLARSSAWSRHRAEFQRVLRSETGLVPLESQPALVPGQLYSWNAPLLSLVWSWPCVRSIVLNPAGLSWEPFDPRLELRLTRYLEFDDAFRRIDASVARCGSELVPLQPGPR